MIAWSGRSYRSSGPTDMIVCRLGRERIVRYEDVIASGGAALAPVAPGAQDLAVDLENRNRNPVYDDGFLRDGAERLLASSGSFWTIYERSEVEDLLRQRA